MCIINASSVCSCAASIKHVEGKENDDAFATQAYLSIPSTSSDLQIRYSYSVTFSVS